MQKSDTASSSKKIGSVRRQAISPKESLVRHQLLFADRTLPLMCEALISGIELKTWATDQRHELEELLLKHGAILFRGFAVGNVVKFNDAISTLSDGALNYQFRASPRTQVDDQRFIYTSTDYPAEESIFPHNEHSYSPIFPRKIFFHCDVASETGGETPIGDTRKVLQRIPLSIMKTFNDKGIMYVRNYGDGFGLPWQTVFQTTDRSEVEAYCNKQNIIAEWKSDDRLRTRQIGPAIVVHPKTGEKVWFNHGTFFHATTLPATVRETLMSEFSPEDLPQNTFYGNGKAIDPSIIDVLRDIYLSEMVAFPWQSGDVLMLDNILALHARNPFTGTRRILTGMAEPVRAQDVAYKEYK